jgi:hypothetical protein
MAARVVPSTTPEQDYGMKHSEEFAIYDPSTQSWRTFQDYSDVDSADFSGTWPRSGMMRNGIAYQLPLLAHHTSGIVSGSWPTPLASDWKGVGPLGSKSHNYRLGGARLDATVQEREQRSGKTNPNWIDWLMGYPVGWTEFGS